MIGAGLAIVLSVSPARRIAVARADARARSCVERMATDLAAAVGAVRS